MSCLESKAKIVNRKCKEDVVDVKIRWTNILTFSINMEFMCQQTAEFYNLKLYKKYLCTNVMTPKLSAKTKNIRKDRS